MTMSRRTPLKATHVLMWSSPVLLLVLVFTLGSNSGGARPLSTTTTTAPMQSTTSIAHTTTTVRTVTTTVPETTPPTTLPARSGSAAPTTTTVPAHAPTHGTSATNAAVAGTLSASLNEVAVPLSGPGTWTLTTTGATTQRLYCSSQSTPVNATVVVGAGVTCQFEIAATDPGAPLTWQLTRTS